MTIFAKAEILTRLWSVLLYGTDEQAVFARMFDISFPLATLISDGVVISTDEADEMINDLWKDACVLLGIDPNARFADFQEFIVEASL